MKQLIFSKCEADRLFQQLDPTEPYEKEFEQVVLTTLDCLYPKYVCFRFNGTFRYEGERRQPDIAMIARDFSHWFVIEVELVSHSLERHVLPQVTAFRYGELESDCIYQLINKTGQSESIIRSFLLTAPTHVVVVANSFLSDWEISLKAHQIQFATVAMYENLKGEKAFEMNGKLIAFHQRVGVGIYLASDRSIVASAKIDLPVGQIFLSDFGGQESAWTTRVQGDDFWITKNRGAPSIEDRARVQITRNVEGKLNLGLLSNRIAK